ncbi:MAG: lytic transglycosylase domain-containing protein [Bacteroidota bacterium]
MKKISSAYAGRADQPIRWTPARPAVGLRQILILMVIVLVSNALTWWWTHRGAKAPPTATPIETLYLWESARLQVADPTTFSRKIVEIAALLEIPPAWLMTVIYAESGFKASVANHKGSGAIGLIQFMPGTATDLGVNPERLRHMTASQQLEYVYAYLDQVRVRYGPYQSLTDLYLAILYPKARGQDVCYTLYAKPSINYRQNAGLDENKDSRVTIRDIEMRMKRLFPEAFMIELG